MYDLTGMWRASGYNKDEPGSYLFRFTAEGLPVTVEDCMDLLTVRVILREEEGGCAGLCGGAAAACILPAVVVSAAALALVGRKKRAARP